MNIKIKRKKCSYSSTLAFLIHGFLILSCLISCIIQTSRSWTRKRSCSYCKVSWFWHNKSVVYCFTPFGWSSELLQSVYTLIFCNLRFEFCFRSWFILPPYILLKVMIHFLCNSIEVTMTNSICLSF